MITLTEAEKATLLSKAKNQHDIEWLERCFETEIKQITCSYRFKAASAKYPDQIFLYFIGDVDRRWLNKIHSLPLIASRQGTREECIDDHFRYRYKFSIYTDYDLLIEDDIAEGVSEEFIKQLRDASKIFPITKAVKSCCYQTSLKL